MKRFDPLVTLINYMVTIVKTVISCNVKEIEFVSEIYLLIKEILYDKR